MKLYIITIINAIAASSAWTRPGDAISRGVSLTATKLIDDFRKYQGAQFRGVFFTATELRLPDPMTALSLLCKNVDLQPKNEDIFEILIFGPFKKKKKKKEKKKKEKKKKNERKKDCNASFSVCGEIFEILIFGPFKKKKKKKERKKERLQRQFQRLWGNFPILL